jgi:hypothetical protein
LDGSWWIHVFDGDEQSRRRRTFVLLWTLAFAIVPGILLPIVSTFVTDGIAGVRALSAGSALWDTWLLRPLIFALGGYFGGVLMFRLVRRRAHGRDETPVDTASSSQERERATDQGGHTSRPRCS